MADVEQRAEAEAQHKGLSGGAARAYVGGVFNRIRQAHSRGTQPGKGARHLKRAARKEARAEAKNRNARRTQVSALERLRLRTRTRREEPRATRSYPHGKADGSNIPALQPNYQPTARDYRNTGLIHDPDAPQGTLTPVPMPAQLAAKAQRVDTSATKAHTGEKSSVSRKVTPMQTPPAKQSHEHAELVPIKDMTGRFRDPSAPVDPYFLQELYGDAQLERALDRYTTERVREAVRAVQAKHPGTKPAGHDKAAMIRYIKQHI